MFLEIIKDAASLMRKNLNLTQLIFILFVIIMGFTAVLAHVKINIKVIPMGIIFFSLLCATFAGIFFAFGKSLEYEKNPPQTDNPFELSPLYLSEFLQGVGKFTPKFIFAGLLLIILLLVIGLGYNYAIDYYGLMPEKFMVLAQTPELWSQTKMVEFINSLTAVEQTQISKFCLLTLGVTSLYGILTMLYPVSLINEDKNFLKSFLISIKFLFKNLPISIILFIFFNIAFTFTNFLSAITVHSLILSIVALLLQCYLCVWYILSLFVYYEKVK